MAITSKIQQYINEMHLHANGSEQFIEWLNRIKNLKVITVEDKDKQLDIITRYSHYLER